MELRLGFLATNHTRRDDAVRIDMSDTLSLLAGDDPHCLSCQNSIPFYLVRLVEQQPLFLRKLLQTNLIVALGRKAPLTVLLKGHRGCAKRIVIEGTTPPFLQKGFRQRLSRLAIMKQTEVILTLAHSFDLLHLTLHTVLHRKLFHWSQPRGAREPPNWRSRRHPPQAAIRPRSSP